MPTPVPVPCHAGARQRRRVHRAGTASVRAHPDERFLQSAIAGSLQAQFLAINERERQPWNQLLHSVRTGETAFELLMTAILQASPSSRGILFDRPAVVDGARQAIAAAGLADRCECLGGDFFVSVPSAGDVYTLTSIIHDWDDERSIAILRSCRQAMRSTSRLLLVEMVLPPGDAPSYAKLLDLEMLVLAGGQE